MNLLLVLPYFISLIILIIGFYIVITDLSYLKKIIGLSIIQSGIILFYILLGKIKNGIIPIDNCSDFKICNLIFSNPLPHVLMLTAIVVGIATTSVGLVLILKIKENFGTVIENKDYE